MDQNQQTPPDMPSFLVSAVHDMKNSMGILISFLENSLPELGQDMQEKGAPILYEVKRVNDNLIQMLAIYKVDNQFYPFDLAEHSVDDFVEEIVEQNQMLLDYSGITMEVDLEEGLSWYFDRDLIAGVISHAMNNAIHYTQDRLLLAIHEEDGELVVRVEDNGKGYPQAVLEAGEAVSKGVNFATGSTGLGLYFSNMVARLHRNRGKEGHIQLENGGRLGGSCFILRLP